MAQSSWPRTVGTPAQRQFTDIQWSDLFGRDSGIVEDYDGTSYALSLATNSDTVTVGSSTQDSTASVGGFGHKIPLGSPEQLTIAPASGGPQTTVIGLRYDTSSTDAAGPCRLVTYPSPGTADGAPVASSLPVGTVVLPLWSITRQPAQVLSAATIRSFRRWLGSTLFADVVAPNTAPIGTIVRLPGQKTLHRQLSTTGGIVGPVWVDPSPKVDFDPPQVRAQFWNNLPYANGQFFDCANVTWQTPSRAVIVINTALALPGYSNQTLLEPTWNGSVVSAGTGTAAYTAPGSTLTQEVQTWFTTYLNPGQHTFGVRFTLQGAAGTVIRQTALIFPTP